MAVRGGPGDLLELQEDNQLAKLVSNWSFNRGQEFEAHVFSKFRSSIHHPSSSSHGAFHLLAIFRSFMFCLLEASVSLALHAALGGTPAGFHVTFIKDRHFQFSVASRHVGFTVRDLKRITTEHFDVYFHLWRDGGTDWFWEWGLWQQEEAASWHEVLRRKRKSGSSKRVSFAQQLVLDSPKIKSSPQELNSSIMFGDFSCNIPHSPETPAQPALNFGSNSKLNSNFSEQRHVSAKLVFGHLKSHLVNPDPGQLQSTQSNDAKSTCKTIDANFCIAKDALRGVIGSETALVQYAAGFAFTMDMCSDLATIGNLASGVNGFRKVHHFVCSRHT
jgi:hypothetical protein